MSEPAYGNLFPLPDDMDEFVNAMMVRVEAQYQAAYLRMVEALRERRQGDGVV